MIKTYHRPNTLDEALNLLSNPDTMPLGGGTLLSHSRVDSLTVVDLQDLNLHYIHKRGNNLELGSTLTLQQLMESGHCSDALKKAIKLEAPLNLRNSATVAGTLVTCDGRSTFVSALLALDARIEIHTSKSKPQILSVGEFLPLRPHGLITQITIPLNLSLAFEVVARTPADKPIICTALAQWGKARTRLVVGGWGISPTLAMDGTEAEGLKTAATNACHDSGDEWASSEYRKAVAAVLAMRCLETIQGKESASDMA